MKPNLKTGQRLYLAGPIRGVADFAERFSCSAILLRHAGYKVFNPVEQDEFFLRVGMPTDIRVFLKHDLAWICDWAQVVALLPGWDKSDGAQAEYYTARACGIKTWVLPSEYCLELS